MTLELTEDFYFSSRPLAYSQFEDDWPDLKEEGRPSGWKDGLARSFVHGSTHHFRKERGSKRLVWWHLGPLGPGVWLMKLRGT